MANVHLAIDTVPTCHELVRMPYEVDIQRRYKHGARARSHQVKKAVEENASGHAR
jgi:hypothetical protein